LTGTPAPPTDVFRQLLTAMMNNDRAGVEAVIVPHPWANLLWDGTPLSPAERRQVNQSLRWGVTMYEVQPGTTVDLPGGYTRRDRPRVRWPPRLRVVARHHFPPDGCGE
jgi:hypothetical protein